MPLYNEERFLKRALDSLRGQDYSNLCIRIFDNASTDRTEEICREAAEADPRIRYERLPENIGSAANFRRVAAAAEGEYFMWAAGHDEWSVDLVSSSVHALEENPTAAIAVATSHWIDEHGKRLDRDTHYPDTRAQSLIGRFLTVFWGNMHPVLGLMRLDYLRATKSMQSFVGADLVLLSDMILRGNFVRTTGGWWNRRDVRMKETHAERMKRYTGTEYGQTSTALDRRLPLLRLPFALIETVWKASIAFPQKLALLSALLILMPLRYVVGRRQARASSSAGPVHRAKMLFTPVAVACLLYFCWQSRETLTTLAREASVPMLAASGLIWALLHMLTPLLAVATLSSDSVRIGWRHAFATHASRLPARYVPGGIWHTVGRVMDYRERGVPARRLTAFVLLENGLALAVTLAVGGGVVFVLRGGDTVGVFAGMTGAVALLGLPTTFYAVNRWVLRPSDVITARACIASLLITLFFWLGAATAFVTYLRVFPAATVGHSAIEVGGIYLFSWGVGFLAVFAPQGIGVFEVVAGELMQGPIGLAGVAALLAGFRIVVAIADIIVWSLYRLAQGATTLRRLIHASGR